MQPEKIKELIGWLQSKVFVVDSSEELTLGFIDPGPADFLSHGFDEQTIKITLHTTWWCEMVTDILETPQFSTPEDSNEQVLCYAKDVVSEYISKRLNP
ncbi:MAG: hypothetical protein HQK83_03560 [Fibrobacteria bacterium]|nr:hypothetical protein [Fibrobacteria bacterium]